MTNKISVVDTPLVSSIIRDEQNPFAVGLTKALVAAHPWGALGTAEDIAGGALFLVSDESQFVTGLACKYLCLCLLASLIRSLGI